MTMTENRKCHKKLHINLCVTNAVGQLLKKLNNGAKL